jgi:hypothetical protein
VPKEKMEPIAFYFKNVGECDTFKEKISNILATYRVSY